MLISVLIILYINNSLKKNIELFKFLPSIQIHTYYSFLPIMGVFTPVGENWKINVGISLRSVEIFELYLSRSVEIFEL